MTTRVLIAEDSPTIRRHLAGIIESDARLAIAGLAADGEDAVRQAERLRPDVITMDIIMPGMDGVEATRRIMARVPTPIVVISSATNERESASGFRALQAGAVDIVEKPTGLDAASYERLRRRIIDTIHVASGVKVVRRWGLAGAAYFPTAAGPSRGVPRAIGICSSTGGPPALEIILRSLDPLIEAPLLIVQHMTEGFTPGFVDWLNNSSRVPVEVATDGCRLVQGRAWVAPDDRHIVITPDRTIRVTDTPPIGHHRPSGTALFTSLATTFGRGAIGVILTGMGRDGCDGLCTVRASGGRVIAQDETTSLIFGMPRAVIDAGVADEVLPVHAIAGRLVAMASRTGGPEALTS